MPETLPDEEWKSAFVRAVGARPEEFGITNEVDAQRFALAHQARIAGQPKAAQPAAAPSSLDVVAQWLRQNAGTSSGPVTGTRNEGIYPKAR